MRTVPSILLSAEGSPIVFYLALCKNSLRAQLVCFKGLERVCSVSLVGIFVESDLIPHDGFCHQGRVEICSNLFNLAVGIPTRHPGVPVIESKPYF